MQDIDQSIDLLNRDWNEIRGNEKQLGSLIGSWKQNVEFWSKMHPGHLHIMRYEDMLAKPFETFRAVNRFLGAGKSDEMIKRAIELSSFNRLKDVEQKSGYEDKPDTAQSFFRTGTSGQWRDILSDTQIKKVVEPNYEVMKRFGYLPEGYA